MRTSSVSSILAALGLTLVLSACDERPPKPPFAEKAAPSAEAPTGQASLPETLPPADQAKANCCACPPVQAACPEAKTTQTAQAPGKPAARPRQAPVRQARAPAPRPKPSRHSAPAPRDYAHAAPPAGHHQDYRRYQGPDIATRGGYQQRAESYQGQYQEQYRGEAYREERYAYAPPPPPQARGYAEQHQTYSEHRSYSQQSGGYGHAVATGPCCAGPPVQAAGRDSGGYLTWPGKRPPAPYY